MKYIKVETLLVLYPLQYVMITISSVLYKQEKSNNSINDYKHKLKHGYWHM